MVGLRERPATPRHWRPIVGESESLPRCPAVIDRAMVNGPAYLGARPPTERHRAWEKGLARQPGATERGGMCPPATTPRPQGRV
jgi:hypothetical protein